MGIEVNAKNIELNLAHLPQLVFEVTDAVSKQCVQSSG